MQNFEPTGAAAAMPGSAVPQIKRRLVISACLLIPLFYLGLGAAFGLPLPPFLTGDNAMWCGIVQLVLTEKGRQFHENTMLALHQTDEYVASLLTEEENTELLRLLNKLYLGLK